MKTMVALVAVVSLAPAVIASTVPVDKNQAALMRSVPGLLRSPSGTDWTPPALSTGTLLTLLQVKNGFMHVRAAEGQEGWVSTAAVSTSSDDVAAATLLKRVREYQKNPPTGNFVPIDDMEVGTLPSALQPIVSLEESKLTVLAPQAIEYQDCSNGSVENEETFNPSRLLIMERFACLSSEDLEAQPSTGSLLPFSKTAETTCMAPNDQVTAVKANNYFWFVKTTNGFSGWIPLPSASESPDHKAVAIMKRTPLCGSTDPASCTERSAPAATFMNVIFHQNGFTKGIFISALPSAWVADGSLSQRPEDVSCALLLEKTRWLIAHAHPDQARILARQDAIQCQQSSLHSLLPH